MQRNALLTGAAAALMMLGGCASTGTGSGGQSPVSVSRFVDDAARAELGKGIVFIETSTESQAQGLDASPYKTAVASRLMFLGYLEGPRASASTIARVTIEADVREPAPEPRGSPISVGVGGSVGSYGSGIGLGVGIDLGKLGAGKERGSLIRRLHVSLVDAKSGKPLWEGRAEQSVPFQENGDENIAANRLAHGLFTGFPGTNGESFEAN